MDSGRRAFFGRLFGGAAVAVPAVVAAAPAPPAALMIAQPICPKCGACQRVPSVSQFETYDAWAQHLRTPQTITCGMEHCQTVMTVRFAP